MANSTTEANWISDALGHNGKKAQLREFKRQLHWLTNGYQRQLDRKRKAATTQASKLKTKIRKLERELG